jgi:hypothetical protein
LQSFFQVLKRFSAVTEAELQLSQSDQSEAEVWLRFHGKFGRPPRSFQAGFAAWENCTCQNPPRIVSWFARDCW